MNLLFTHRVYPGQFRNLIEWLSRSNEHQVRFLTRSLHEQPPACVGVLPYAPSRDAHPEVHACLHSTENAILYGQAAWRAAHQLKEQGFSPEVIIGHSGWGSTLFLRDVFPKAVFLGYFEWFYRSYGSSHHFHPNIPVTALDEMQIRTKNTPILMDLVQARAGITPTQWQRQQFPAEHRHKIAVIHDGVDCDYFSPLPGGLFLPRMGLDLRQQSKIVTYVATGMEPMRGFPEFMRAVSLLQKECPDCHAVVVGEDRTEYSNPLASGKTYRQLMLELLPLDTRRLHFVGRLSREEYRQVLRASTVHVYLTFPFILSWSLLESMACGCLVLGSATPPVREVIVNGQNGLLVDFFDVSGMAKKMAAVLADPAATAPMRQAARETVLSRYESGNMLKQQWDFIRQGREQR